MSRLMLFESATKRDPAVEVHLDSRADQLGVIARRCFDELRGCGDDVRELLHDGHPTACVGTAAFAYVAAFKAHVNLGFYQGAELPDPDGLLEGSGRMMRHVKLRPERIDDEFEAAVSRLIDIAYSDLRERLDD